MTEAPGSGNFGHKGVIGQLGGSAPGNKNGCSHNADAFSPERKAAARSYDEPEDADNDLRETSGRLWQSFDDETKMAFEGYTGSDYRKINAYLRGMYTVGQRTKDEVEKLTDAIGSSELPEDIVLFRGTSDRSLSNLLGVDSPDMFEDPDFRESIKGITVKDDAFLSCGTTKNTGMAKSVQLRIYCPKGTKGIYAEPFSECGDGDGVHWDERRDGKSSQDTFSAEFETILQRGTTLRITGCERTEKRVHDKYIVDCEVVMQEPKDID